MVHGRYWLIFCCWLALPAYAGSSPYLFSLKTGLSRIDSPVSTDEVWLTQFGYQYQFSPFIGFDVGYSGMIGDGAEMLNAQRQNIDVKVEGFYFGAFMEQPLNNMTMVYARGGLARMKIKERHPFDSPYDNQQYSGTNPYLGVGTKVQSSLDKSLAFTMELSYQFLEQDYSSLSFTLGGQYRF
ncbi:outer membrane protein [Vibrio misgurnus]|uniref:outer membrane protein n=1 Tax=Vibrio misgurnus TaxID=2993714 RepID=UPI0023F859BF|nr:hypothetical protein [Vibrio sp. VCS]